MRVPLADGTLVALPDDVDLSDDRLAAALATLTDVMGTGHHGVLASGVGAGGTAVVVGDGAVGLCAVLAARRLGAERVIVLGHHAARLEIARRFGATDVVAERGEAARRARARAHRRRRRRTSSSASAPRRSYETAIGSAGRAAPSATWASRSSRSPCSTSTCATSASIGGVAPVRGYIPELMEDVLAGRLDPSPVLDLVVPLEDVPEGYAAMDERRAIKVLVRTGAPEPGRKVLSPS